MRWPARPGFRPSAERPAGPGLTMITNMGFRGWPAEAIDFYDGLEEDNSKSYWQAHKAAYEQAVLRPMEELLDDLAAQYGPGRIFRPYRDVRFSADKSPYKTAMSALLGRGGRKSKSRSYYFHIESEGRSMLAGGLYDPSPAELAKLRMILAEDAAPFRKIIEKPEFRRYFGAPAGESLKTAPQGYAKDHPDIGLLRMKQFIAVHQLADKAVLSEDLVQHTLTVFKAMKPFVTYLESALEAN